MSEDSSSSAKALIVTHRLTINSDMTWNLFVYGHEVTGDTCIALGSIPCKLQHDTLSQLLYKVEKLQICAGHPDTSFIGMIKSKKGKITSHDNKIVCFLDTTYPGEAVRTTTCEILSPFTKCSSCKNYRANLRALYHRFRKKEERRDCSIFVNERYLNTPQKKAKMMKLKQRVRVAEHTVSRLQERVRKLTQEQGEIVDRTLNSDMLNIKNTHPEGSFARLFWEEQFKVAPLADKRQARWHPVMIRWCLNLKLLSSSAYHAMRTSGFITLPSERTLRDYTNYFRNKPGFMDEVDDQLMNEISPSLPESRRTVALLINEMKIKEGLVYNKHSGEIIGFTNLGDVNDELLRIENDSGQLPIAKNVLFLMGRGSWDYVQVRVSICTLWNSKCYWRCIISHYLGGYSSIGSQRIKSIVCNSRWCKPKQKILQDALQQERSAVFVQNS